EHDAVGRIAQKTETWRNPQNGAQETRTERYTYDGAGRLSSVILNGSLSQSYTYGPNGNRIAWTDGWGSGTAAYDAQDRLLSYGTTTYVYTAAGEQGAKSKTG